MELNTYWSFQDKEIQVLDCLNIFEGKNDSIFGEFFEADEQTLQVY